MNVSDFTPLSPLVRAYELQPGKHYFVICDGRDFSFETASALLKDLRENHPELTVLIVATTKPKSMEVGEKCPASLSENPESKT